MLLLLVTHINEGTQNQATTNAETHAPKTTHRKKKQKKQKKQKKNTGANREAVFLEPHQAKSLDLPFLVLDGFQSFDTVGSN